MLPTKGLVSFSSPLLNSLLPHPSVFRTNMRTTGQIRGVQVVQGVQGVQGAQGAQNSLAQDTMIHFDAYNIRLDTPTSCDKYPGSY